MLENMLRLFYNFPISFFTILLQRKKKNAFCIKNYTT